MDQHLKEKNLNHMTSKFIHQSLANPILTNQKFILRFYNAHIDGGNKYKIT
jgi:hypothetical protein